MNVSVGKLYESVKECNMILLAGGQGLNRIVKWVHITESEEICNFLEGEELVFITGVALEDESNLIKIVKAAIKNGASGIVINKGPYIKEIAVEILELCEDRQVPIFTVPWSTYMGELMRQFCLMITLTDKKEVEMSSAIKNAILFPNQQELYGPYLENYSININGEYTVLLINMEYDRKDNSNINKKMLLRQIENYADNMKWPTITVEIDNEIVMLFTDGYGEEKVEACFEELVENCTCLRINREVLCGIGQVAKGIKNISKSYDQAKSVINLQKNHEELELNKRYSELGIYKILLKVSEKDAMNGFVQETIGKVLKYDEINDSNLENVLRIYLKNNGSVKETADMLFIHRNTVNYKINKINKILQTNLSDYEACSNILIALKLRDILQI